MRDHLLCSVILHVNDWYSNLIRIWVVSSPGGKTTNKLSARFGGTVSDAVRLCY